MADLAAELTTIVGEKGILSGADAEERAASPTFGMKGHPAIIVRPKTTEEVSEVLRFCNSRGIAVVPWGGTTGLVEGALVSEGQIALSLERMNEIEEIDEISGTMVVQAGVPLQTVQEAAEAKGLMFPLDLGARGSATIGGNISTNAGGNRVIRYGMTRDMVLGLEGVLADGTVIPALNKMIKNNAGYDVKQLFIGTEGTLGVVTKAVLRLRRLPTSQDTAFVAAQDFQSVTRFLRHMDGALGGKLSAFEVMWQDYYKLISTPPAEGRPPVPQDYPYYILVESLGGDAEADFERFEKALEGAFEQELICDAVIAKSQAERDAMWALRDDVGQVLQNWPIFTFDVSLVLKDMEAYVEEMKGLLNDKWEDHTCMIFGHLGDGNLHVIVGVGSDSAEARAAVEEAVYGPLRARGGSVSAEHGIGLEKRAYLSWSRSPAEIALMGTLKRALDPNNILNPGKVLASAELRQAAE